MPGVIMMAALFALFTIEMYLKAKGAGHDHGGPMGSAGHGGHNVSLADQGARPGVVTAQTLPSYGSTVNEQPANVEYVEFEKPHAYTQ